MNAADRSSAYERDAGLPASAATVPATPIAPARTIDGLAPVSGTYSAIRASTPIKRPRRPSPSADNRGQARIASSVTFWPETASRCESPDALKSSTTSAGTRSSSPSTMPRASAA